MFLPPKAVYEEFFWVGDQRRFLVESDLRKACLHIALYLFTWLAGGCALSVFGHPLADSLFEFASAIGTVGLSVGVTTATAPAGQLWVEIRDCGNAAWALGIFHDILGHHQDRQGSVNIAAGALWPRLKRCANETKSVIIFWCLCSCY